jgi:putative ABC transport system permease protein
MADWLQSFRYAFRALRRQPTFVLIALLTLALGIGANTALFSIIQAVVLNPLPYDAPEKIVVLWEVNPDGVLDRVAVPTFEDWKRDIESLESVAAYRRADFSFARTSDPLSVSGVRATSELFAVLKAGAHLGRTFLPEDGLFGAARVVVLSDAFWRRVLGGEPGIIGSTIQLDAEPYTVVGVMPAGFEFPTAASAQLWTPLAFDPKDLHGRSRRARSLMVVGRLSDDATVERAQEEVRLLAARIAAENRDSNEGWSARVVAAHDQLVAGSRPALLMLMGAVGFLLLIVCANMANLLLARLSSRRREIAVRGALGGGRWEIARPILAESLLLSLAGGVLGWLAAAVGLRLLAALPEARLPRMDQIQLDGRVLLFATALSIGVALAFGLLPALQASRGELRDSLNESVANTATRGARRLLNGLVVAEVALALILLVGASLMTRSFSRLLAVNPGFDPANVIAAQVFLPTTKYRERHRLVQFFEDVVQRVRNAPGVTTASAVSILPMNDVGAASALPFAVEGQQPPKSEDPLADVRIVTPGYFETMKIQLIEGRFLDERDGADNPRASVINEVMARRYFPDRSPLGQTIVNPHGRSVVVGVVADVRNQGLDREPKKQVYLPLRQSPTASMAVVARTERDPSAFASAMRTAVWAVDAEQPIYELSTMDQILARAVFLPRMSTTLLALFAGAALLLAALGLYGVLSYVVSLRTREIGLRMALGASGGQTIGLVLRNSSSMLAAGVVIGLVGSILAARSVGGVLYGISPFDVPAFSIAAGALAAAGLIATLIPALRAARVDPMTALREIE